MLMNFSLCQSDEDISFPDNESWYPKAASTVSIAMLSYPVNKYLSMTMLCVVTDSIRNLCFLLLLNLASMHLNSAMYSEKPSTLGIVKSCLDEWVLVR